MTRGAQGILAAYRREEDDPATWHLGVIGKLSASSGVSYERESEGEESEGSTVHCD